MPFHIGESLYQKSENEGVVIKIICVHLRHLWLIIPRGKQIRPLFLYGSDKRSRHVMDCEIGRWMMTTGHGRQPLRQRPQSFPECLQMTAEWYKGLGNCKYTVYKSRNSVIPAMLLSGNPGSILVSRQNHSGITIEINGNLVFSKSLKSFMRAPLMNRRTNSAHSKSLNISRVPERET